MRWCLIFSKYNGKSIINSSWKKYRCCHCIESGEELSFRPSGGATSEKHWIRTWVGQRWTVTFDFKANRRPPERILQCNGKKTGLGARILGFSYWLCLQLSVWPWPGNNQFLLLTTMLCDLICYLHMIDEAVRDSWRLPKEKEQVSVKAKLQAQVCPTLKSTFLLHKTLNPSVLWLPHLQNEGAVPRVSWSLPQSANSDIRSL